MRFRKNRLGFLSFFVPALILSFMLAESSAGQVRQTSQGNRTSAEANVRAAIQQHATWFNAGDWQGIKTEFTDDVVAMLQGQPDVVGRDAVGAFFRDELAQFAQAGMTVRLGITTNEVQVHGDWAFAHATFSPTFTRGDLQRTAQVRFVLIFQKQRDGAWKIARFMTNSPPPAASSAAAKPAPTAPDQRPSGGLPSVDQILEKYVQALGGRAAIEKLVSRVFKGTIELPAQGATGSIELYAKAPNKTARVIEIPGFGLIQTVFDGAIGWNKDPQGGLRDLSAAELALRRRDSDFYRDIKLKEIYPRMAVVGSEKVGDKTALVIVATPQEGNAEKLYFDAETGLLVRRDVERESPQGKLTTETYFENFRQVDGVKVPFVIRVVHPVNPFTIKLDDVKHNVAIDDNKFAKPTTP